MLLHIIADYGFGDFAFAEVVQSNVRDGSTVRLVTPSRKRSPAMAASIPGKFRN